MAHMDEVQLHYQKNEPSLQAESVCIKLEKNQQHTLLMLKT